MILVKIAVKDNRLIKVRDTLMIEDTINAIKCQFEFRTDWSQLNPKVIFAKGHITPATKDVQTISLQLDENNECVIPREIISERGYFSIGMCGESADKIIPTNWLYYSIKGGCYEAGITINPPTKTVYDKIIEGLNNKSDINHTHDEIYYTKEQADNKYLTEHQDLSEYVKKGEVLMPDVVDNLVTNAPDKPLSAAQGVVLDAKILQSEQTLKQYINETIKQALNTRDDGIAILDAGEIIKEV